MPRHKSSTASDSAESPADRLQTTVNELAQNVRVLTEVVDQLREDIAWLTRNGVPHQPVHVLVHRMPHVPAGEGSDDSIELSLRSFLDRDSTAETLGDDQVRSAFVARIVEQLAEPLGQLAQEQLNTLLSVIDHSHREVMQAIRNPQSIETAKPKQSARKRKTAIAQVTAPTEPTPPPGQLF